MKDGASIRGFVPMRRGGTVSPVIDWQNRIVMGLATAVFIAIALKASVTPVGYAESRDMLLKSSMAITDTRAAEGGFPLAVAAVLVYSLLSPSRYRFGLIVVIANAGLILALRLIGTGLDNSLAANVKLIVPETVLTTLAIVGLVLRNRALARVGVDGE